MLATSIASADHRRTYIVHMDDSKNIQLNSFERPKNQYQTILDSISKSTAQEDGDEDVEALAPELLYTYETTMTGFAAKLSTKQYEALTNIDGVLFVAPDEILSLHTTYSTHFLGLELGRGLWNSSSLAADVIIGVLDTGIWPEHISFCDTGFSPVPSRWKGACEKGTNFSRSNCNKKLIGARAFLKGYEAINGRINETDDFRSARDSNGHGTHTASTTAGSVVPGASLFGMAEGVASGMRYISQRINTSIRSSSRICIWSFSCQCVTSG